MKQHVVAGQALVLLVIDSLYQTKPFPRLINPRAAVSHLAKQIAGFPSLIKTLSKRCGVVMQAGVCERASERRSLECARKLLLEGWVNMPSADYAPHWLALSKLFFTLKKTFSQCHMLLS